MTLRDFGISLVTFAIGAFYLTADGPPWLEALYGTAAIWATAEIFNMREDLLYRLAGDPDRITFYGIAADERGPTVHVTRDLARRRVEARCSGKA